MSADTWLIIAVVSFSVAGIAAIAAILLYFLLHIHAVIGDLTGRTVAREIKALRESNERSGDKSFQPGRINLERGKLTEKVDAEEIPETDELAATDRLKHSETTELLAEGTEVLTEGTTVLASDATTVLSQSPAFKVKRQMLEIHTEEKITES